MKEEVERETGMEEEWQSKKWSVVEPVVEGNRLKGACVREFDTYHLKFFSPLP